MRRIGTIVAWTAFAVLSAGAVSAQQSYDPVIPRGVPEQRVEPFGELTPPSPAPRPPRLVQNERRTQRDSDARHCLTLATNREVHRCSLRYRNRMARAAAVKTSAKASSAKPITAAPAMIEPSKPAVVVKPGAPRPGDTAKAQEVVKPMDVTKPGGMAKSAESTAKGPDAQKPAAAPPAPAPAPAAKPAAPTPPAAKSPEPAKK